MKLVDILARDLPAWPNTERGLSQSFGGMIFFVPDGFKVQALHRLELADDWRDAAVTRAQWQTAVDALKAENCAHLWVGWSDTEACELCNKTRKIVVEWDGEGLPPVGVVCEFAGGTHCPEDPFDKDLKEGDEVTIIAHFADGESTLAAFTFNPRNLARGNACVEQGMHGCFRPIRTPEQIAADELQKEVSRVLNEMPGHLCTTIETIRWMLESGYRKFEIVDN